MIIISTVYVLAVFASWIYIGKLRAKIRINTEELEQITKAAAAQVEVLNATRIDRDKWRRKAERLMDYERMEQSVSDIKSLRERLKATIEQVNKGMNCRITDIDIDYRSDYMSDFVVSSLTITTQG